MMLICFASHISFLLLSMSLSPVDSSSSILSGTTLSVLEAGFFCPAGARWHWPLVTPMVPKFLVLLVLCPWEHLVRALVYDVNIIRDRKMGSPDQPSTKSNGLPFPGKCASWEEQGKTFLFSFAFQKNQLSVKSNKGEIHIKIQWAC